MKVILTSDTHKERSKIEAVKQFALDNEIETIVDCGDLHGAIDAYQGINYMQFSGMKLLVEWIDGDLLVK